MSKESLDGIEVGALVQQVGGKTVAECMNAMALIETGIFFWRCNMHAERQIQSALTPAAVQSQYAPTGQQFLRGLVGGAGMGFIPKPFADAGQGGLPEMAGNVAGFGLSFIPMLRRGRTRTSIQE